MHLALASGLDTDQGLDLAEKLVQNPRLSERIKSCRDHIRHGEGFGQALLDSGIFSGLYASWITIGFKTGAMDEVMARISRAYEEEAQSRLDRFISVLEPTLVIILSVFIGLILISFLLPLLGIMSSIG
jgi:type IV pilus assembly protein PilC